MTLNNLLIFYEKVYGEKYDGIFKEVMIDYLANGSEAFYKSCAEIIVKRYSRIYNKVPDPAILEKHMDEILANIPDTPALPQPEDVYVRPTPEEHEQFITEMREILSRGSGGPMSKGLESLINNLEEKNESSN